MTTNQRRSQVRVLPTALKKRLQNAGKQKPLATPPGLLAAVGDERIFSNAVATTFGIRSWPNMKELPVVKVESDVVQELADLIGLHNDLASVGEMCRRLSEIRAKPINAG